MRTALIALVLFLATGCSFPGVYKIDIQQGNIVTQEMIDQLSPGMTRRQMRFIMGTPLIKDTFNQDRWDYVYSMHTGEGEHIYEKVTLFFEGDNLAGFSGDYVPNTANQIAADDDDF